MVKEINCPECSRAMKRINANHIALHGMTVKEFELKYPGFIRTEGGVRRDEIQKSIVGFEGVDFVTCPICKQKYKELNSDHVEKHGMTIERFSELYPMVVRTPEKTRFGKNHFKVLTKTMSQKLRRGHTIEGLIEKYGEEEGRERFGIWRERKRFGHTLDGYVSRYGQESGTKKYLIDINGRKNDLSSFQRRHGDLEGARRYFSYIESISKRMRMFDGDTDMKNKYEKYRRRVRRISNESIARYGLDGVENRSMKFHVDHRYPIILGFLNGVHPVVIGSIYNLEMMSGHKNCQKKVNASIDLEQLKEKVESDAFYSVLMSASVG